MNIPTKTPSRRTIELLAPAKDKAAAIAAITCGADAIYVGAANFSARQAAGNSMADIKEIIIFAHQFNCRVYAALNTILNDNELIDAGRLIWQLSDIGIDGIIIQDMGLLGLDWPDVPVIASTQMHNDTPEKVKFLQDIGFTRVILARELSLDQIKAIRQAAPEIELECFVHGALCVSMSGRCYISYALGGRSGNRGCCAQPCRKLYTLSDEQGKVLVKDKYLLSIKDLNLSDYLGQLIDAGINSFKIEGRLKAASYVANIVGFYNNKLEQILDNESLTRASSGKVKLEFEPDPAKTFSRGFTTYNITGQQKNVGSIDTPKATGEYIGKIRSVSDSAFIIDSKVELHNGDGICFLDDRRILQGTQINRVDGNKIIPLSTEYMEIGTEIYRNADHDFNKILEKLPAIRKINLKLSMSDIAGGLLLKGLDEDGISACVELLCDLEEAKKQDAREKTAEQLAKFGNTIFNCIGVEINTSKTWFLPVSVVNQLRRDLCDKLMAARHNYYLQNRKQNKLSLDTKINYPIENLDFSANVYNEKAQDFYHKHGVNTIEPAAESGLNMDNRQVMQTRYCIRHELGSCPGKNTNINAPDLYLTDREGNCFQIKFTCNDCGMKIFYK
ncbi:MAG: U32 family peptidase [Sedimentisphaerales bacterium]|nr:U32 family peptidase [Sedimentisphaerales bacterium]